MALITPDFSEATTFDNTPIVGTFKGRITNAEVTTSKAGDPMIKWEFTLFGADGDAARYNNRKVWYYTMAKGKGSGGLKTLLGVIGLNEKSFDTDQALSKEVQLTLGSRSAPDGRDFQDVKAVAPIKH